MNINRCLLIGLLVSAASASLSYGGVLDSYVAVDLSSTEMNVMAQFALSEVERFLQTSFVVLPSPRLSLVSKHILKYTSDGSTPLTSQARAPNGGIQTGQVIMGVSYAMDVEFDLPPSAWWAQVWSIGPVDNSDLTLLRQ